MKPETLEKARNLNQEIKRLTDYLIKIEGWQKDPSGLVHRPLIEILYLNSSSTTKMIKTAKKLYVPILETLEKDCETRITELKKEFDQL